jgi:cellulose synthase/poly-beta-1,6-N-acetylglucosamine synthase-like glycosyltransferase
MTNTPTIAILIPCHNEEKMIAACVNSCLAQTRAPDQVIVVNDGSTDGSGEILRAYGDKIIIVTTPTPTGNKSRAQEIGLKYVTTDVFIATDGDTILDSRFVEAIEQDFRENPELSAVAGYVKSLRHNAITALREIDYVIGQDVHKMAQSIIHFVLVIPGCAGAFRSALFQEGIITFEHDTLTEDMDFTYKINRLGLEMQYDTRAIAYTQDPPTIGSYIQQMRRWYGGGWQNLRKHRRVIWQPNAALQLTLIYFESLMFAVLLFALPLINVVWFVTVTLPYLLIAVMLVGAYASVRRMRADLFLYSPLLLGLIALNATIFLEQFFLEIILRKKNMVWFRAKRVAMTHI